MELTKVELLRLQYMELKQDALNNKTPNIGTLIALHAALEALINAIDEEKKVG